MCPLARRDQPLFFFRRLELRIVGPEINSDNSTSAAEPSAPQSFTDRVSTAIYQVPIIPRAAISCFANPMSQHGHPHPQTALSKKAAILEEDWHFLLDLFPMSITTTRPSSVASMPRHCSLHSPAARGRRGGSRGASGHRIPTTEDLDGIGAVGARAID